jgi:hypothetical protein
MPKPCILDPALTTVDRNTWAVTIVEVPAK